MLKEKLRKFTTLVSGIYNYNIGSYFHPLPPTALQVNVTYRCNSRCQMCQIWKMKPKNEFSFSEWKRILDDPIFLNIERLLVAGGEPFLYPELFKLCRLFASSMPKLQSLDLVTNGFLPKKTIQTVKQLINFCQKKGIDLSVSVSLDGIGKNHDNLRGVPGAFDKVSRTILELKTLKSRYNFGLNVGGVICKKNLYQIIEVEKWCQENNISFNYQIVGFHETYVQNLDEKEKLDFTDEDRKYLYSFLEKISTERSVQGIRSRLRSYYWQDMLNLYKGGKRTTPCPFIYDAFVLGSLGDVYYCLSEKPIGNIREGKSVSEIYYDPKNFEYRKRLSKTACLHCNSGCMVSLAIAKDFKKLAWFALTGKTSGSSPI